MSNKFFTTSDTAMALFWQWFNPDEKQQREIEELIQSILLNNMLTKLSQQFGREKTIETLKNLNQPNQEPEYFINAAFAALELGYYDLIMEINGSLNQEELADLQQYLEKN